MILSTFRIGALGVLLCGLAAPAAAADRDGPRAASPADSANRADHSRRVELPFLLDFRPTESEPRRPVTHQKAGKTGPHPYRDIQLEQPLRASLDTGRTRSGRLSPQVDFG